MISKLLAGSTIVLLLATTTLFGLWKAEQVKTESLKAHNQALDQANNNMVETINELTAFQSKQADMIAEYSKKQEQIRNETQAVVNKLNRLRQSEAQAALAAPFERGNAARDRRHAALMRFTGQTDGRDTDNQSDPEAKSSSRTSTASP